MDFNATEIAILCDALPESKRMAVADFARFLLERGGDERWEDILNQVVPRPRLESFLRESANEGAEKLDLGRL